MPSEKQPLNRDYSATGLLIATVLIVALQTLALYPFLDTTVVLSNTTMIITGYSLIYLIGYATLPLIYYILIPHILNPKRIVSPLLAQIGTISILIIIITIKTALAIPFLMQIQDSFQNLISYSMFLAVGLGELGFGQLLLVRKVVGLSFESADKVSYIVEGLTSQEVIQLLGKSFLSTYHFTEPKTEGKVWITQRYDIKTKNALILSVTEQPNNPKNTIIATVAYHKDPYLIRKSAGASGVRDEIIDNIKGKVGVNYSSSKISALTQENIHDDASTMAFLVASSITVSKVEVLTDRLQQLPLYYRILIAGTVFAIVVLSIAQLTDNGNWVELIATLIIALALEIGLQLRTELKELAKSGHA